MDQRPRAPGTAVVTGASGGIGLALAGLFARDGHDVVLVARDEARLTTAASTVRERRSGGGRVTAIPIDLSEPGAAAALFGRLDADGVVPAAIVNNAGFGLHGRFTGTDLERELAMIQLNVVTLTAITKLALQRMLPRKSGRILQVASTAAFQPGPFMAVYAATKAYVLSLSEAIANETRGSGVTITTLCPGPTATGFEERAGMGGARLFRMGVEDAETVARRGYDGLMRGKRLVVSGLRNRLMIQSLRLAPRFGVLEVVRWMQE